MPDFELPTEKVVMNVDTGVCRFIARITVHMDDEHLHVMIESGCPYVKEFESKVKLLGRFDAIKMPFTENIVFIRGGESLKHSSCPIPTAVIKCAEACAGFALKRNVKLEFEV